MNYIDAPALVYMDRGIIGTEGILCKKLSK